MGSPKTSLNKLKEAAVSDYQEYELYNSQFTVYSQNWLSSFTKLQSNLQRQELQTITQQLRTD